jgi:hypothetical protein
VSERMEVEFRPDDAFADTILDEVVIQGAQTVHAEMMSDSALWIGISNAAGHLVHVNIWAERKGGKTVLRMRGEDQGVHPPRPLPPGWMTVVPERPKEG